VCIAKRQLLRIYRLETAVALFLQNSAVYWRPWPMASGMPPPSSYSALVGPEEQRLQQHCLKLADSLFRAHYMKDVYLKCSDDVSVPVHKFVLGAQSLCEPLPNNNKVYIIKYSHPVLHSVLCTLTHHQNRARQQIMLAKHPAT
jgi:hypothetical protein